MSESFPQMLPERPERWQFTGRFFPLVTKRYENAIVVQEGYNGLVIFVTTGTEEIPKANGETKSVAVASFKLATSQVAHADNRGEVLTLSVPLQRVGDLDSGLALLEPGNADRFVIATATNGLTEDRFLITNETTSALPSPYPSSGLQADSFEQQLMDKIDVSSVSAYEAVAIKALDPYQ